MDSDSYKLQEFVAHSTTVNCLTFGPLSNQVLATGGEDCKVNIWRVGNATNIWTLGQKSPIESLCFDNDEQYIVSGALNGSIKIFDLNEGKLARSLIGHKVNICTIHYHPFGEFIVSGSVDTSMKVWDVRNKNCIQTYSGHEKEITCVRFSPDGRWVASSGKDGQLFIWDLVAGKLVNSFRIQPSLSYATSFEFNPSEFLLAAVTSARSVRIWDLETMEQIGYTPPESSQVKAIAFSSQGTNLCTASSESLKVFEWDPVSLRASTNVGWDRVSEIRVSGENQLIGGSCFSNFVSIWSADIEQLVAQAALHSKDEDKRKPRVIRPPRTAQAAFSEPKHEVDPRDNDRKMGLVIQGQGQGQGGDKGGRAVHGADKGRVGYGAKATPPPDDAISARYVMDKASDPPAAKGGVPVPEVQWSEGITPFDVATTMSESFSARAKMQQDKEKEKTPVKGLDPNLAALLPSKESSRFQPSAVARGEGGLGDGIGAARARDRRPISSNLTPQLSPTASPHFEGNVRSDAPIQNNRRSEGNNRVAVGSDSFEDRDRDGDRGGGGGMGDRGGGAVARERRDRRTSASDMSQHQQAPPSTSPRYDDVPSSSSSHRTESQAQRRRSDEESRGGGGMSSAADAALTLEEAEKLCDVSVAVKAVLQQRTNALRMLHRLWVKGDMSDVLAQLNMLNDSAVLDSRQLVVLVHFFEKVDLRGKVVNLDACMELLPIIYTLLLQGSNLSKDNFVMAALKATSMLCISFGNLIRQTRAVVVAGGVDLSREERLQKCNTCHKLFSQIYNGLENVRRKHKASKVVVDQTDYVSELLEDFL